MINELTSHATVDEELAKLKQDLRTNLDLINDLAQIQTKFSQMESTYEEARQFMRQATATLGFLQAQVGDSVATVEAGMAAVQTSLRASETTHAENRQELQTVLEQKQSDLQHLYQQVQQSLAKVDQRNNTLAIEYQNAQQQFQQTVQTMVSYQHAFDEVEQTLRNEFISRQTALESKVRWQRTYTIILLLLLIGLYGYIASPAIAILLN